MASCTTSGNATTCTGNSSGTIGSGPSTASGYSVTLQPSAQLSGGNANAISLGDNAVISLGANSVVTNTATSGSGSSGNGLWNAGKNTIEFGSNGQLTIGTGATVSSLGTSNNAEAINVMGVGNVITNYGTITSRSGAAIWFEDRTTGGSNTIDNYGTITTSLGANSNVIGNNSNGNVNFINESGAVVNGSLSFASGNDTLTLFPNSTITGGFDGGGGTNTLILNGTAGSSDTLSGSISNFQTLTKTGLGTWTLSGAVGNNGGAALAVEVQAGTLALTGNNSNFKGSVLVDTAGTLEARAQSLPPTVTDNGLVRFAQDTTGTYAGIISGMGAVEKTLGATLTLTGANTYSGGTTVNLGEVVISSDANLGAASGGLTLNGGALGTTADVNTARTVTLGASGGTFDTQAGTLTVSGTVGGTGTLTKSGAGTLALAASNTYAGDTIINQGTVQIASDANLGAATSNLQFNGGTLATTADVTTSRTATLGAAGGTLQQAAGTTLTDSGVFSGTGMLTKTGDGTLTLTAVNTQTGGTAINGGTMIVSNDAQLGDPSAPLQFDGGTLVAGAGTAVRPTILNAGGGTVQLDGDPLDPAQYLTITGPVSGTGSLTKTGTGTIVYSGDNSYTGPTTIAGGFFYVNGNSSAQTGTITAENGTRLSGDGTIGGNVVIQDGATIGPGAVPGTAATLTINGDLILSSNSILLYNLVQANTAGGALNDLINVGGNLTLDGTFNVLDQGQTFGPGVYRIINYNGTLTDNGLTLGNLISPTLQTETPLTGFTVQTAIPGQVNLINTTGLTLNYWDGDVGPKNDGVINGGDGIWQVSGPASTSNWTGPDGTVNAPWANGQFAVFAGTAGTVQSSDGQGQLQSAGMQFAVDGYTVQGDMIQLVGSATTPTTAVIRVGDGTANAASMTATITSVLSGSALLDKTDLGMLILTAANTYSGGTEIDGGTIQIASDTNLGSVGSGLVFNGGTLATTADITTSRPVTLNDNGGSFAPAASTTLTLDGTVSGIGSLTMSGAGTLVLPVDETYAGGTTISSGTLQLGNGGTSGSIAGDVTDNGMLIFDRSDPVTFAGAISGTGAMTVEGGGAVILTADSSYTGGTTITGSTLQIGDGNADGSITGNVTNNGTLAFNRSDTISFGGVISGTGTLTQAGSGTTVLTGANGYTGATAVNAGSLYINGNQSAATAATSVASGATLGGTGIIGGDVNIAANGTLSPGGNTPTPGTLTIKGNLSLDPAAVLNYSFGQANVVGGPFNDLTNVQGNLALGGTLNVVLSPGGSFDPGIYRVINYGGSLSGALALGSYPAGETFYVQTAVANQVNLINASGLNLNYWDGDAGPKNSSTVDGGDGTWRVSGVSSTFNWTGQDGVANAPWDNSGVFAVFQGARGNVTVSSDNGQVEAAGMQFATDGYTVGGDSIELVGSPTSIIRVGDGASDGAAYTATINAVLSGGTVLEKADLGTLILTAANTYTGGTAINGGTLQISSDDNLGAPGTAIAFDQGTLATTANITTSRPVTLNAGGFAPASSTTLELDGMVSGAGSLTMSGQGTLLLTADETYSGGTTITAGTLQIGNGDTPGSIQGNVADGSTLIFNRSATVTYSGVISDYSHTDASGNPVTAPGQLAQNGTGTLVLTGNNTYTGVTTIAAGTLQLGNGGTSGSVAGDIVDNGTLVVNRSDTYTVNGLISGTGDFVQDGTGTVILTGGGGVNLYSGTTYINQGTLQLGTGGTTGGLASQRVINNGVEIIDLSLDFSTTAVASGTGSVIVKLGANNTMIVLGNNTYTGGSTLLSGTVQFGDGGTDGLITGTINNFGTIIVDHSDDLTYPGLITGTGNAIKEGPDTLTWTSDNTYTGGTLIADGTLQLGNGGTTGSILGDVVDNAALAFNRSDSLLMNGVISGTGSLTQMGTGTIVLGANDSYTGGTTISAGTLQVGNGDIHGSIQGDVVDNAILSFSRSDTYTFSGTVSGTGELVQIGPGTLILTAANSYSGGTAIDGGVLQISSDANLGAPAGELHIGGATLAITADITNDARQTVLEQGGGTFDVPDGITLTNNGPVSGAGGLTLTGGGLMILSGENSYAGPTVVSAGTLFVNGDQTAAAGPTSVANGATLGGTGIIGGDVDIADGATLAPGDDPGTLTIKGSLTLHPNSVLAYELGAANVPGGALNDLTEVGGDLVLDGMINVTEAPGGAFEPGVYRVIDYAGTLTDNGLTIGTIPSPDFFVQTSVANQVNLVNTTGLTLNFWDGAAGPKNDGVVQGGNGVWQNSSGNDNWTNDSGAINAPFTDAAFAVFEGTGGTVTVDASLGAINVSGMQFAADGYVIQGDAINLVADASGETIVRVGDGTSDSTGYVTTIASVLTGDATLVKDDLGTLVLAAAESYTGGTDIEGGTLQIGDGGTTGSIPGDVTDNGVLAFDRSDTVTFAGVISGAGVVEQAGSGTTILTADNSYTGGTIIAAGTLQIGDGGADGSITGDVTDNGALAFDRSDTVTFAGVISGAGVVEQTGGGTTILTADNSYTGGTVIAAGILQIGDGGADGSITGDVTDNGVLVFNRADTITFGGAISGSGSVTQLGGGTTILTGDSSYTGGTTIAAGILQIGDGGTSGSITGEVTDNAALVFDRADTLTFDSAISGTGSVSQQGSGATILTGGNSYAGPTIVAAGALYVDGDQSAATGPTSVAAGATLGGTGIIGGDVTVADGGMLAPGGDGDAPGTLTINRDLTLGSGAALAYSFGQANVEGGPFNDLTDVGGNLTLAGTLNVTVAPGGSFEPGVYRIINYAGTLTDNGLAIGSIPSSGFYVQTSVAQQVNLVNPDGLALNFWDGDAGPKNNGAINGGNGTWTAGAVSDNWTGGDGAVNAPWANGAFAIFAAAPGTVTVDDTNGQVAVAGMQFTSNGYVVTGDAITLAGSTATPGVSIIRVGDGTTDSIGETVTIDAALTGSATLEKTDLGTLILAAANSYTGGTAIDGGVLQISSDANLGDAAGALSLDDGTLATTADITIARAATLGSEGGTFDTASGTTLTLNTAIGGTGALTKSGAGTLLLTQDATYAGGTIITMGTLQLGNGGTAGGIVGDVTDNGALVFDRSDTITFGGAISGTGAVIQQGSGTVILTGSNSYSGTTTIAAGTLAAGADNVLSAASVHTVASGATLALNAYSQTVAGLSNGGTVDTGGVPGTVLTVAGDYAGTGGTLAISTVLGGDDSATDRMSVAGNTSGTTTLVVRNIGGSGAPTTEGIKVVSVGGASSGSFVLKGDYTFEGDPAIVAGAYGYRLYQNGISNATDGAWYLRSTLTNPPTPPTPPTPPAPPAPPPPPLYQPGVPVYQSYTRALLTLDDVSTLQERVGNRYWDALAPANGQDPSVIEGQGFWARVTGMHGHDAPGLETASATSDFNGWGLNAGYDGVLSQHDGGALIGGVSAHFKNGWTDVTSIYGDGSIDTSAYGFGGSLTWYGRDGLYVDEQAQLSWFGSDLNSRLLDRAMASGNDGFGYALSVEGGQRFAIDPDWTLTPQAQLVFSSIAFDRFADPFGASVSSDYSDSLKGRLGLSADREESWKDDDGTVSRSHVYGLVNLYYQMLGAGSVDVSGTRIAAADDRLWGGIGVGGSYNWQDDAYSLYGEVSANSSLANFGDSYDVRGTIGLRMKW